MQTLKEVYEILKQKAFQYGDEREGWAYFRAKDDPKNEQGYDYIYWSETEITLLEDGRLQLEDFDNSPKIITDIDGIIGYMKGENAAYSANSVYEAESNGHDLYKKTFFETLDRLLHNARINAAPPPHVEEELADSQPPSMEGFTEAESAL